MNLLDLMIGLPGRFLSKKAYTRYIGWFARKEDPSLARDSIEWFIARFGVDLGESERTRVEAYRSFNDFFTRRPQPGARPLAEADWLCPADGVLSQFGAIQAGAMLQAKGHRFTAQELLGGDPLAEAFTNGCYATIYLSPSDFHRVHMPCSGRLLSMAHIPGTLHSVSPASAAAIPRLYARNERVVSLFDGPYGLFAVVLVGATVVGSIVTAWHGQVTPPRSKGVRRWDYRANGVRLEQGQELGHFLLGSTVILLARAGTLAHPPGLQAGMTVRLGRALGSAPRRPAGD